MLCSGKHQLCPKSSVSCTPQCVWLLTVAHGQCPAGHCTPQGSQGLLPKPLSMENFQAEVEKEIVFGELVHSCTLLLMEKDFSVPQASPQPLSLLCGLMFLSSLLLWLSTVWSHTLSPLPALSTLKNAHKEYQKLEGNKPCFACCSGWSSCMERGYPGVLGVSAPSWPRKVLQAPLCPWQMELSATHPQPISFWAIVGRSGNFSSLYRLLDISPSTNWVSCSHPCTSWCPPSHTAATSPSTPSPPPRPTL